MMDQVQAPNAEPPPPSQPDFRNAIFTSISTYPFTIDPSFQSGLSSILRSKSNATPAEIASLTTRAECFYYARKYKLTIDVDAYEAWKTGQQQQRQQAGPTFGEGAGANGVNSSTDGWQRQQQANGRQKGRNTEAGGQKVDGVAQAEEDAAVAPYPVTFNEMVELISSGKPIPGIKEIPNTVLEGQKSAKVASERRKPWERAAPPTEPPLNSAEQAPAD